MSIFPPPRLFRPILALTICLAGALLFVRLGTVLPWMLGPLISMALATMAGLPVEKPRGGLPMGQFVIGAALGLYFTGPVLRQIADYAPYVMAGALFAFVLGSVCAFVLSRLSGCDFRTAFFASLPGGAAEMSVLAERMGGRADWVAAAHAVRIILVVLTVPPLLTMSGVHGAELHAATSREVHYAGLAAIVAISCAAALLLRRIDVPNSWVIGPLLAMIIVTGSGVELSALPQWSINGGQLLIGCGLGSRFNRGFFRTAPRFLASSALTVCLGIMLAAGFACALALVSGINLPTSILATAPGGVAEMSITATVLQFGVPIVTAFHVSRMAILVVGTAPLFALGQRYVLWRAGTPR
ncbi:MAG: putative ammonia monooxygenase [Noviherbaspirillum sp.]|nr:putative ammonia monooxygenase [Noviherbaspirillum sp.]MDB5793839.1 putative ammonia monooxygenase [Noviherbaspirillum sp.]